MKILTQRSAPYIFIAPALILLFLFSLLPIFLALAISFTDMDLAGLADFSNITFVGLENYVEILQDPSFLKAIWNTIFYVVIGVPLVIVISLSIALLINFGKSRVFELFRAVFYMPAVTNVVAVAVVWSYLYNPTLGLFNYALNAVGLPDVPWLQDPVIAKISLIILALWRAIGLNMLIFLAAIKGIPKTYYEAAQIDGASTWRQVVSITLPLLKFAIFFVTVTTLIGWLQFFEEPFVMTNGGPLEGTMSVALFVYKNGFQFSEFGYAAAGSFILFFAIIAFTLLQFKLQKNDD